MLYKCKIIIKQVTDIPETLELEGSMWNQRKPKEVVLQTFAQHTLLSPTLRALTFGAKDYIRY